MAQINQNTLTLLIQLVIIAKKGHCIKQNKIKKVLTFKSVGDNQRVLLVIMVNLRHLKNNLLPNFCGAIKNRRNQVRIKEKGMEVLNGKMEESIMVNGIMELFMVWAYRFGKMVKIMLGFIIKIEEMVLVSFNGPLEKPTRATGNQENNMD